MTKIITLPAKVKCWRKGCNKGLIFRYDHPDHEEAKAEAVVIYWTGVRFGFSQRNGDDPYIAIPAAEVREFLSEAIRLAAVLAVEIPVYKESCDEFLIKAKTLKATLPEE